VGFSTIGILLMHSFLSAQFRKIVGPLKTTLYPPRWTSLPSNPTAEVIELAEAVRPGRRSAASRGAHKISSGAKPGRAAQTIISDWWWSAINLRPPRPQSEDNKSGIEDGGHRMERDWSEAWPFPSIVRW
jgi:hypothetical protein